MPTDKAAFSYQPKDLKSVCRGVRARFLLDEFLGREPTDLPWTFRDTLRLTFVSLGRKTLFLVARLRHQINGEVSRQVIGCQAMDPAPRRHPKARWRRRVGAGNHRLKIGAKACGARRTTMLRRPRTAAALCFVAALGSLCVFATSADAAKHRSSSAAKHAGRETATRRPRRETGTNRRNRSDPDQQERLPHRLADSLWASRGPFQASKTGDPARIYPRCIEPR